MKIKDAAGRHIDYARISVTDRCNYRCLYCMPESGVESMPHSGVLRYEEIIWLAGVLVSMGIRHIRFTGGEPLVRKGMPEFLVSFRREFPDLEISLTTNASLLEEAAPSIALAGLSGLNISLDTLDAVKFSSITRRGDISSVLSGISAVLGCKIGRIKTNTVVMRGFNDDELPALLNFAWERGIIPRMIEFMPLSENLWGRDKFMPSREMLEKTSRLGDWEPVLSAPDPSHGPARYWRDVRTGRIFGVIEAVSNHFCSACNRLRITASGRMRACLFNKEEISLIGMIRERDREAVVSAVTSGINLKPGRWRDLNGGSGDMSVIGG
ncbi:MAG: GTP 3',8-cyclase MoaA [Synergistaceae bacterium]|jgi:cyclic pyranopterin phosphate synthase|nr:GTP 3',8-cyclase MoaA [Synergistaceae bacterium]